MEEERGTLTQLEQEFLKSLGVEALLSKNFNIEFEKEITFKARPADRVAE